MPKRLKYSWAQRPREKTLLCKKEDKDKNNPERKEEWEREAKLAKNKLDS